MELILYIYCKWYQFDIIYNSPNLENIKQIFELIFRDQLCIDYST